MQATDLRNLIFLASLWGSSFMFMRVAIGDFGPLPLIAMRVSISALFLLAVALATHNGRSIIANWKAMAVSGVLNVALPFLCLSYAVQTITAGTLSIINSMVPLFGGIIAWAWLGERLSWARVLGLAIGFTGIVVLMLDKLSFVPGGEGWVLVIALGGPFFYGLGACHLSKYLHGVAPIACATGSMIAASAVLLPLSLLTWPATPISALSWGSVACLAILCTGIAYLIFYRLVARVGASKSITVTFLAPPFGVFWGVLLLDEPLTINVILGAAIVLVGTLLATGFIGGKTARA
jgi:drug/metabolite transporter (DMT)-like permease